MRMESRRQVTVSWDSGGSDEAPPKVAKAPAPARHCSSCQWVAWAAAVCGDTATHQVVLGTVLTAPCPCSFAGHAILTCTRSPICISAVGRALAPALRLDMVLKASPSAPTPDPQTSGSTVGAEEGSPSLLVRGLAKDRVRARTSDGLKPASQCFTFRSILK